MTQRYNWKQIDTHGSGSNPPIPRYQAYIGRDSDGNNWLCDVTYREQARMFMVRFDTDTVTEKDSPFLRDEVVNARLYSYDFWNAQKRVYSLQLCNYERIEDIVQGFAEDKGLTL